MPAAICIAGRTSFARFQRGHGAFDGMIPPTLRGECESLLLRVAAAVTLLCEGFESTSGSVIGARPCGSPVLLLDGLCMSLPQRLSRTPRRAFRAFPGLPIESLEPRRLL